MINNRILFINLFLLSCILLVIPSKSDNISDVCDKAQDPDFCTSTIGSASGAKTADTTGLEVITLNLAEASVKATNKKIEELKSATQDPNMKALLTQCGFDYKDATIKLQQARSYLGRKQFVELAFTANGISNDGITCENSLQKGGVTSPLTQENNELSSFSDIIRVIAHILAGGAL